jgi:iron complex transport system ATP-binding protein
MQAKTEMLTARRLGKKIGSRWILRGIDLTVTHGEMVGILGPNGSGKSTLIRLLTGEWTADEGEVWLDGQPVKRYSHKARARKVAVLTQETMREIAFTVREVVQMGRHPYQGRWPWATEADRQVVEKVMEETGLLPLGERLVPSLSGGERQRVAIARTMAQEPLLLVLDEPTTYLDIHHQLTILDLLKKWQHECGLTLVVVLHDLNLAAQYCDRLLFLKKGQAVKIGPVKEVLGERLIEEVYGVKTIIVPHPEMGVPQVFLQPRYTNLLSEKRFWPSEKKKGNGNLEIHA